MAGARERKREQVLQAARAVFEQHGIRKLTLEDVASEAGLAVSSLYYYFENKNELLKAVAELELTETLALVEANVAAAAGPEEQLNAVGRTILSHVRRLARLPGLTRAERAAVFPELEQVTGRFKLRLREVIQRILERGAAAGVFDVAEPELAAFVISAGIRGLAESVLEGEVEEDILAGMDRMSGLLMNGLKKR